MVDLDELEQFLCLDDLSCWRMNKPTLTAYEVLPAMLTELRELRAENARLRSVASSFEVQGPYADNLLWLIMRPQGTTGQAMFNLGGPSRIAGQVASIVEQDRRAALTGEPQ